MQLQPPVLEGQRVVGRDDVDVVGLDLVAVAGLRHRHGA